MVADRVLWVTFLEVGRLLTMPQLLRIRGRMQTIGFLRNPLLMCNLSITVSRFQQAFMGILQTITSGQMGRILATLSRIVHQPRSMLPLVVDLPWVTSSAVAGTDFFGGKKCINC